MVSNHSRRDFLRYAMVGGVAVPLTFAPGFFQLAQAKAFNFAADPNNLTDMERIHLPKITLPPVVEDGSQAPIQIELEHPMDEDHYIKSIQIINFNDPLQTKGNFYFSPLNGEAFIGTQIRLSGGESTVWAIAECNQHGRWAASRDTKVAAGGC
ncbi:MAG: thiosulfate oxidation carrier protein SoxY [Gammaproteobacteria bacterium]